MTISNTYSNDTVTIIGLSKDSSNLKFIEYFISNQTFNSNITLTTLNSLHLSFTRWDGSLDSSYLRVHSRDDTLISKNLTSSTLVQFPIKYFCVVFISTNYYGLMTDIGKYYLISGEILVWEEWEGKSAVGVWGNWIMVLFYPCFSSNIIWPLWHLTWLSINANFYGWDAKQKSKQLNLSMDTCCLKLQLLCIQQFPLHH